MKQWIGLLCVALMAQNAFGAPHDAPSHDHVHTEPPRIADFGRWLVAHPEQYSLIWQYHQYLENYTTVPPMNELLTTARDWQACGYAPYEVPPKPLWGNIVPTLRLYDDLKRHHLLPYDTVIRSVYRSPGLNECAGGAKGSKHLNNAAIDVWSQAFADPVGLSASQNALCQFWRDHGKLYRMGLGLYATGAIHLDTQGYRKWGVQYTNDNSPCRD